MEAFGGLQDRCHGPFITNICTVCAIIRCWEMEYGISTPFRGILKHFELLPRRWVGLPISGGANISEALQLSQEHMHVNISQLVESLVPVLTIAMKKHCLIILVGTLVLLGPVADAATLYDYYDLEISGSGSSGEGSSSGSGSSGDTEEGQCVRPQPLPDPPSPQDDPVLTEIRCHVGCLDRVRVSDKIIIHST